jgi:hypothetical protein
MAHRIIAVATAAMPESRRDWGRAISAELEQASGRVDRLRLVLAAMRVALVPPRGCGGYGRAVSRLVAVAVIAYVPLGAGQYVANVIIRPAQDSIGEILLMDGYLLLTLLGAGALARRATPRTSAAVVAGLVAGLVLAACEMGTWAWLDNAFFSVIGAQPEKIQGFQESGLTSMHAYLTASLESTAPGVTIAYAVAGAVFAPIGAAVSAQLSSIERLRQRMAELPGGRAVSEP